MKTHIDLFSGIGGFALAARWVGIKTIQFVENDPFCQKVLQKNFKGVPIHGDIKTFSIKTFADTELHGLPTSHAKIKKTKSQIEKKSDGVRKPARGTDLPDGRLTNDNPNGQVSQSSKSLRDGIVNSRTGRPLQNNSPSNVEDSQAEGMSVTRKFEIRRRESFLQGNKSIGQSTESIGTGNRGRKNTKANGVPEVWGIGEIQGRTDDGSSTSSRLRETIGSDVVMPTMSPRDTQGKYGKGGDHNGIQPQERPFILTGGFP